MKKLTRRDVFDSIDLTELPHGGNWSYDSEFSLYSKSEYTRTALPLLDEIAESLSMDGRKVVDTRKVWVLEYKRFAGNWETSIYSCGLGTFNDASSEMNVAKRLLPGVYYRIRAKV